jgi:hypothetical protein
MEKINFLTSNYEAITGGVTYQQSDDSLAVLSELQLSLVGGGIGDTVL